MWVSASGRIRAGLIAFVFLLGLLAGGVTYHFLTKANRLHGEAVELMNQGKYDSALAKLEAALAENPHHVPATFHRGLSLVEKHRWDEALAAFEATLRLDPDHARAHYNRGRILWMRGRFEQAAAALQRATDLKSPFPDAWVLLAECYYELYLRQMLGGPDSGASPARAVAAFKTYLRQRPNAPDTQTVERKLQILQHVERYPQVLEQRRREDQQPIRRRRPARRKVAK